MPAIGSDAPTPEANANAEAAWPDGNEVERGMETCRVIGTAAPRRSGRRRRPRGLRPTLTPAEVTASEAMPLGAGGGPPGPPTAANTAAAPSQSLEWSADLDSAPSPRSKSGV